jgi:hypothetical protein
MTPGTFNLRADRGKQLLRQFTVTGLDLTSATFRAAVRAYPDAPGDPIIALPLVTNTDNGMKFVSVETVGGVPVSLIQMQISAATMALASYPAGKAGTPGDPVVFWLGNWDLNITPSSGIEEVYLRGAFQVDGVVA